MLYGEIASIRNFILSMVSYSCFKVNTSKNQEKSADYNDSLAQVGAAWRMRN